MRVTPALVLASLLVGCQTAPLPSPAAPRAEPAALDPSAVVAEVERLAAQDLWPGFDPRAVPVAIFDGERTLLFRHPAPPEGFRPVPDRPGVWVYPGRQPSVTANTSVDLGGVQTATLMPPAGSESVAQRAGLLIHESFHVFQRERRPTWTANEAELFSYPVDHPELLALRRLETEALRRALAAAEAERSACWARQALEARRERFAALPAGSVGYERGSELNEGLATYVEYRATGAPAEAALPDGEFPPEALRQRSYWSGLALARLLDRFYAGWREALMRSDDGTLDALLASALETRVNGSALCTFTPAERQGIHATAQRDVDLLRTRRVEQRRDFLEQAGWRLIVVAPGMPLFPQGFDPLNVQTVADGEVLHTRFLKLGNPAGTVEMLGRAALTEAAGAHPLFNGVRTLHLTGFAVEPAVSEANGVVTVQAEGLQAEVRGATVEWSGQTITVRLPV
jgi:hypothetical protein